MVNPFSRVFVYDFQRMKLFFFSLLFIIRRKDYNVTVVGTGFIAIIYFKHKHYALSELLVFSEMLVEEIMLAFIYRPHRILCGTSIIG
jgi:membrane-anchored protein YejM (alkaline phosphatase superfamily)